MANLGSKKIPAKWMWVLTVLSLLFPIVFPIMLVAAIKAQIDENKERRT